MDWNNEWDIFSLTRDRKKENQFGRRRRREEVKDTEHK